MFRPRSITRRSLLLAALLPAALLVGARAEAQGVTDESQVKAMFVYNFLKFVEWPVDLSLGARDPFVVVIIGGGATADAAERFLESRAVGDRPLHVRRARWDQSLTGVRAAFIVERINQTSHLTLHGLKAELTSRGVKVSHDTVWKFLLREGLRFKKNTVRP